MLLHVRASSGYQESLHKSLSRKRERIFSVQQKSRSELADLSNQCTSKFIKDEAKLEQRKPKVKNSKQNQCKKKLQMKPSYVPEMTLYQKVLQKYF
ncbi:unnamed protein product (macronuclear) [Paramecium tetraurelia]|uniref:Uncharacterized protein n=1 Tax=Paramecium tetraurelia TaxID=5888 RepID=A0DNA0_PARTE|nr:uncharacterized protein GSPATT00018722001 [Paramecium tetraurelia]CAK84517.1 unnamed protein product [Paramecium tetraurelia]|eukprot:XP_001451914.1 hypothetical protein (macronuclear) [Paramecium tetraurelia strain d4-2]